MNAKDTNDHEITRTIIRKSNGDAVEAFIVCCVGLVITYSLGISVNYVWAFKLMICAYLTIFYTSMGLRAVPVIQSIFIKCVVVFDILFVTIVTIYFIFIFSFTGDFF